MTMSPLDIEQVHALFDEALTYASEDRTAFLDRACSENQELRREVTELLDHHALAGPSYLEPSRKNARMISASQDEPDPLIGKRVGQYLLKCVIGSGGMGCVYEATQKHPKRTVAIKMLAAWTWSKSTKRRFEFESQILARLSHPHIAQIYESATFDEMPYFVMEYIANAMPITSYADDRSLTIEQRLKLMIHVCSAVQHGHQKGVIHRDLKPGNILVDGEGYVKVIDFGVARSTDSDVAVTTIRTDVGQLIGTLQYMSPEQCQADPLGLDVRSDVYSLGIVLYELLCGRTPYDVSNTTIAHAARVICEDLPTRPGSVHRSLRGDLELILLKALEKNRDDRYQSAMDLGRDLQRFLSREPIEAKAPTTWTRLLGWFRGHPIIATSLLAGLVALSIIGGSMAAVEYAKRTPWRVEVTPGDKEVQLIALNGTILHTWESISPANSIGGTSMDAVLDGRKTKLALIMYDQLDGGPHRGELCAFDIGHRQYELPLWCDRVHSYDLPQDPTRTLTESEFYPHDVWPLDIYPEIAGQEILVQFSHYYSRRAIRVYSATGDRLYQTWHDGAVHATHFLTQPGLLVVAAVHDTHPWRERGQPSVTGGPHAGKPLVVFAFRPEVGKWNRSYLCIDGETQCVVPAWYKCVLPANDATRIARLHLGAKFAKSADEGHFSLHFDFDTNNNLPANAGWIIDRFGNRVGDEFMKNDGFLLQEDNLPPIESFYLGSLPPIVRHE